jgi:glycine hydroxymethyltransferase
MHVIAAKAICFEEAMSEDFKQYIAQVVKNAKVLGEELVKYGFRLVSGGTDNHLLLVDLTNKNITGKEAEKLLDSARITVNKNTIPFETQSPFITSGIRIGTSAVTTRGFKEEEMKEIAYLINKVIDSRGSEIEEVLRRVDAVCSKYPIYK